MSKKRVRVRSKRLDQLDEGKLSLALWLLARGIVEDKVSKAPPATASAKDGDEPSEEAA